MTGWNKYGREYWGTGQRGNSGKRDCHCASSRDLNVSTDVAVTISSVSVWDYSDAERMLATTSLTPLLVNLDLEAQCGWGQQRLRHMESRGGRA